MPIRQPVKTTIHSDDFRDHTFSFPVESILQPQQGTGKLVISASSGYLLTTSLDHEPNQVQTLDHVLQPDGNLVARGTITLLAGNEPLGDSTVTIRNPSGETIILTVDALPETALVSQRPTLFLSTQSLTFPKAQPGKPTFMVIAVAQQNATTSVTVSTDAPDYFQLASDTRPAFAPNLTLTPSPTGTYVHVRYLSRKSGLTQANLIFETQYTTQRVSLSGQTSGWLPVARPRLIGEQAYSNQQATTSSPGRWLLLITLLATSLTFAGYYFRCQLIPELCREATKIEATTNQRPSVATGSAPGKNREETGYSTGELTTGRSRVATLASKAGRKTRSVQLSRSTKESEQANAAITKQTSSDRLTRKALLGQPQDSQLNKLSPPLPLSAPTEESELERELNRKPSKKSNLN